MNKLIKGAVAGAAGIALLLGGVGSFALWNGTAKANAGVIQSGTLALTPVKDSGSWTNTTVNGAPVPITISDFHAVPGDTLTFTQTLNVTAIGTNLKATLALDPASIVVASSDAPSQALKDALVSRMTVTIPAPLPANFTAGTPGTAGANTFTVTGAADLQTVTVSVTLPFPKSDAIDNTTQAGSVDLTQLAFTLRQN